MSFMTKITLITSIPDFFAVLGWQAVQHKRSGVRIGDVGRTEEDDSDNIHNDHCEHEQEMDGEAHLYAVNLSAW